jgi:hypothetical protein
MQAFLSLRPMASPLSPVMGLLPRNLFDISSSRLSRRQRRSGLCVINSFRTRDQITQVPYGWQEGRLMDKSAESITIEDVCLDR